LGASHYGGDAKMKKYALVVAILVAGAPLAHAAAQQAVIIGGPISPILRIGTEVPVRLRTELTTKHKALRVGQRFEIETTEPVMLDGHLVIPVGTPGVGEVTSVTNKGMWGKSGHFDIRLLHLRLGDRQIRLAGTLDDKGVAGGVGAAAVSAIVFLPAGFFMTGTSARMPAGTIVRGSIDEDVPVSFAGVAGAQPLIVPQAAVPVQVPASAPAPTQASVSSTR